MTVQIVKGLNRKETWNILDEQIARVISVSAQKIRCKIDALSNLTPLEVTKITRYVLNFQTKGKQP